MNTAPVKSVAIAGFNTYEGKELKSALDDSDIPIKKLILMDEPPDAGTLTEFRGEPLVSKEISMEEISDSDILISCLPADRLLAYLKGKEKKGPLVIDMSGLLSSRTSPLINMKVSERELSDDLRVIRCPHSISLILSFFLNRLKKFEPSTIITTVFVPVSEEGKEGMDELLNQTVNLLNFKEIPKDIFDAQLSFNLIPVSSFSKAVAPLDLRVKRETQSLLGIEKRKSFELSLIKVPVFHGYSLFTYVRFSKKVKASTVISRIGRQGSGAHYESDFRRLTPIDIVGQEELRVGVLTVEKKERNSYMFWILADNILNGSVMNAVRIVEKLTADISDR